MMAMVKYLLVSLILLAAVAAQETVGNVPTILVPTVYNSRVLQISVTPILTQVNPGNTVIFRTIVYNLGATQEVNVTVNYTVKTANGAIGHFSRNITMRNTISMVERYTVPKNATTGNYLIEASARLGNVTFSGVGAFQVTVVPTIFKVIEFLITSWVPYFVLLVVVPVTFIARKYYKKYQTEQFAKRRYVHPLDFNKLPKPGSRSMWLGKLAETDKNSYYDMDKLTVHMVAAGGTGSGKSVSIMVIVEEVLRKNIPVIVFDPTAQWTGFSRPQDDPAMLKLFPKFGLKPEDAQAFKSTIIDVTNPDTEVDVRNYMKPGELTIFNIGKMDPSVLDKFVRHTVEGIFKAQWPESHELRLLIVYDEVHRLLPKFGGKGGYIALERGAREFRKWGIGLIMISQVLLDFKGAIRTNIGTEIQLRTKYEGDINRVKTKYGAEFASTLTKLAIGTGIMQNPEYNDGKPWYVSFRPLLHSTFRISEEDIQKYKAIDTELQTLTQVVAGMKAKGVDVYDIELELNLAKDKAKSNQLRIAETYLTSVKSRLETLQKGK